MMIRETKTWKKVTALVVAIMILGPALNLYAEAASGVFQKGMAFTGWDKNCFSTKFSDLSLQKLSDVGVEYVSICVTQYQDKYNSTKIKATSQTPKDAGIKRAIRIAHKLGMKVMLKPHIDIIDEHDGTYWRADIGFAKEENWKKWAGEYVKFITHYAKIAEKNDVEIFCVGTELSFTTQKTDIWRDRIIPAVRKIYSGKIIYAANWDNYKNVEFWQDVDYVGVNAYFPLTYAENPSVEEIRKGWQNWKNEIALWQKTVNKPVIFTEIGYASTGEAASSPWKNGTYGNPDIELQTKCYKAFFDEVYNEPWLQGVYWWRWSTNAHAGGKRNRQYTPQKKPAQELIKEMYSSGKSKDYAMTN